MARLELSDRHSVSGFWPKPSCMPTCVCKCVTPPPLPCHLSPPTVSLHHPVLLFHVVHPRWSHSGSILGFWPKIHPPPCNCERTAPQLPQSHLASPIASLHPPVSPFHAAHLKQSHGGYFGFLAQNLPPALRLQMRGPTTAVISSHLACCLPPLPCLTVSCSMSKMEPWWLCFRFLTQSPPATTTT
jgi:hypothetical protein